MNCIESKNWMLKFESLNNEEQQNLHQHLNTCSSCNSLFSDFELLNQVIEKEISVSVDLSDRIMDAIEEKQSLRIGSTFQVGLKRTLIAASISMVIWGGYKTGGLYTQYTESTMTNQEITYFDDASLESLDSWIME